MTRRRTSLPTADVLSERGIALITVLLLTGMVSALTLTLTFSGSTRVMASRNSELYAQARAAAEAGLNHGAEVTLAQLRQWQTNGFANQSAAMSAMLRGPDNLAGTAAHDADNGSLETFGIPRPPARLTFVAATGTSYEVRLFDEDDAARGTTLSNADVTRIGENGTAASDANARIVLRAIGYARGDTEVRLEATIAPVPMPALVVNGPLTINGNPSVDGTMGSIHANGALDAVGSVSVSRDLTSSGTFTMNGPVSVGGDVGGGRPLISVPPISAIDHKTEADFIATSTGVITNQAGTVLCTTNCSSLYGWEFMGAAGWRVAGNSVTGGTYYVQGDLKITGSPGTPTNAVPLSVISEGSIDISGNPSLRPDLPELQFVTNGDLKIAGSLMPPNVEGLILVREQVYIGGTPRLRGQIIVENVPSVSTLVTSNALVGNAEITYNGLVGGGATMNLTSWREVR